MRLPVSGSTKWPSIAVVIPHKGRSHEVIDAIRSVDAQTYPGQVRVLVVRDVEIPLDVPGDLRTEIVSLVHEPDPAAE